MDENKYREMFSKVHSSVNEEDILMETKGRKKHKILTLPLVAALVLVLGAGAAFGAAYLHSLNDAVMDENVEIQNPVTHETRDARSMSLQGFAESPEFEAAKEWYEFNEGYDTDEKILDQVGNDPTPWDDKYGAYLVYSQEMADKLDEICEKYDLKLHEGQPKIAEAREIEKLFGNISSDDTASGYYFDDGTFQLENIDYELDGVGPMEYEFRRTMKGIFDDVTLTISNEDEFEQWEYETSCGETVLLAKAADYGLIIYENDDCFAVGTVNPSIDDIENDGSMSLEELMKLCAEEAEKRMTKEALEKVADTFDYRFDPSTADEVVDPTAVIKLAAAPIDGTSEDIHISEKYGEAADGSYFNYGIDIAAPEGTPVCTVADGTVKCADDKDGLIVIDHDGGWYTTYEDYDKVLVKEGEKVKAGQQIATVGTEDIHFEIHDEYTNNVDPEPYYNEVVNK